MCDGGGHDVLSEESGATGPDSEGHVTGAVNRQKMMNALEMEEWRKVRRKKWKVARPNDKLVVRARILLLQDIDEGRRGREVQMSTYRLRVVADQRSALLTHPSDSVNADTFSDGGSG